MPLPGQEAQLSMAAMERLDELKLVAKKSKDAKQAATMMLLYPKNDESYFVLIERMISTGKHSGQIAFPGGRAEKGDKDFEYTALRETEEEIGIPISLQKVITAGTPLYIPPSNFMVRPYLGYLDHSPIFKLQATEVKSVIEVPLQQLMDEANVSSQILSTSYLSKVEVPCFLLQEQIVWGATAMMLSEFKAMFKQAGL
ncbi:CoA pyrophosphatase [Nonlabens ponticola]|uniref:CoA pyrophosphatase n=2 Tax=Nonlabens ponticola TaxID=2496866 RepID=A0A3S9N131_9FLAO|nr:CoA pyrophosphatase [Nonlabens ponticola]